MGNRDVPLMVAEQLNMYLDYGPRTRDNTWGCALLSKFPIVKSKHYLLPSPEGELACAIHATLDLNGDHVDVLVAHNGQEETPLDRELQVRFPGATPVPYPCPTRALSVPYPCPTKRGDCLNRRADAAGPCIGAQTRLEGEIMRNATNPIIFVGYVVTKPHQPQYKLLMDGTTVKDIDPTDTDRWCEYIAYKGLERVGYARISHGGITDTEMQVGRFRIGSGRDNTDEIPASEVPADLKFTPYVGVCTRALQRSAPSHSRWRSDGFGPHNCVGCLTARARAGTATMCTTGPSTLALRSRRRGPPRSSVRRRPRPGPGPRQTPPQHPLSRPLPPLSPRVVTLAVYGIAHELMDGNSRCTWSRSPRSPRFSAAERRAAERRGRGRRQCRRAPAEAADGGGA